MAKKSKKESITSTKSPLAPPVIQGTGPMDPALIERFISLMAQAELTELDVSEGNKRISLKRGGAFAAYAPVAAPAHVAARPAPAVTTEPAALDTSKLIPIKSPMVGTFYSKPTPDSKQFVTIGASVNEDSDVCIIEAMKVFNNIKAEVSGKIEKIMVENGQVVEFGQVLFWVKG